MNIYDISNMAGVSIATVSRVLNNSGNVSVSTRKRVLEIIDSTGYSPNNHNIKNKQSQTIGLLCNCLSNSRTAYLMNNIIPALQRKGFTPLLTVCDDTAADIKQALDYFSEHKTVASIVDGTGFSGDALKNIQQYISALKYPLILLDAYIDVANVFCVMCDIEKTAASVTDTYIKSGCRSPLFLFSGMSDFCISMLDGFKHACSLNGINIPTENLHICPEGMMSSYNYISDLISGKKYIDFVMCSDNDLGMGVYKAVTENNDRFNNVTIVGCGYTSCPDSCPLPISSIYCRDEDIYRHIMELLTGIISKKPVATKTVFSPIYLKKDSVKIK